MPLIILTFYLTGKLADYFQNVIKKVMFFDQHSSS
jgi:hypothetical protein